MKKKEYLQFAKELFREMNWGEMPKIILRIQDSVEFIDNNDNATDCMGLCEPCFITGYFRVSIALKHHKTTKDIIYTLIHELIHVKMIMDQYPWRIASGHGKEFRKFAKEIERASRIYKAKRIVKA